MSTTNDKKKYNIPGQTEEAQQPAAAPTTTAGVTRTIQPTTKPHLGDSNMETWLGPDLSNEVKQVWGEIPDGWEPPDVEPLKKSDGSKKTEVTGTGAGDLGTGAAGADNTGTGAGGAAAGAAGAGTGATAPVFKDSYGEKLKAQYDAIVNRQPFSYNAAEDPLYQQYVDKYVQGGRLAMRDSMGQAAALTGGYGSSYGQAAGQQQYNEYMRGLADAMPELYGQAYDRYEAEGDRMLQNYQLLGELSDQEYSRYRDEYSDYVYNEQMAYDRQQDAYTNLQNLIAATGMIPTEEQLAAAGMTEEEAHALRMEYAKADPKAAVRKGLITEEEYKQITGKKYKGSSGGGGTVYSGVPTTPTTPTGGNSSEEKEYDTAVGTGGYNPDRIWEEYEKYLNS